MKTLSEAWGSEVKFTKSLTTDLTSLNKVAKLCGLPSIIKAQAEFQIPGGAIDVVGFTSKGEAIVFEHQDQSGRADQTHVNKTIGYPIQLHLKGHNVLGSILLCESVDQFFVDQINLERNRYLLNKKEGFKNLFLVKSQWTDDLVYEPTFFESTDVIASRDSWPINEFTEFCELYAKDWVGLKEEHRPTTITLWFRDISRGNHYVHKLKSGVKVGVHFVTPTAKEKALVNAHGASGRHSAGRSTIEYCLTKSSPMSDWWLVAEQLKQSIRRELKTICNP